jgi:hypothetical protein
VELYVVGGIFLVCAAIAGIWFYNDAVNDQEAHDRARRYREGIEAEERRKARLARWRPKKPLDELPKKRRSRQRSCVRRSWSVYA